MKKIKIFTALAAACLSSLLFSGNAFAAVQDAQAVQEVQQVQDVQETREVQGVQEMQEVRIIPEQYIFSGEDSCYEIDAAEKAEYNPKADFGKLFLCGDMKEDPEVNGFRSFDAKDGNLTICFRFDPERFSAAEIGGRAFSAAEDSTKKINGCTLGSAVRKGALLVQTSLDGEKWTVDAEFTDVLSGMAAADPLYEAKTIQLINGCYYRVIFACMFCREYKTAWLFVPVTACETVKIAEVYQFYAEDQAEKTASALSQNALKKKLGELHKVKTDQGYCITEELGIEDPHYGWNLGNFYVSAYTRETEDGEGTPVFLKNAGDRVTLWFQLQQGIDQLDGSSELTIAEDRDGYDRNFGLRKMNLKHGALILRFTDPEGIEHEPVVYTDFLAACTRTGADTRVELFEEGDYEVSLDYKIRNCPRAVAGVGIFPTYTDYTLSFRFSVRNGNCMVFPFDLVSGNALSDHTVTENGFRLDFARSEYLEVNVTRKVIRKNAADIRFNRPAKDGDQYTEAGVYVIEVMNRYTGEKTSKTIYVTGGTGEG